MVVISTRNMFWCPPSDAITNNTSEAGQYSYGTELLTLGTSLSIYGHHPPKEFLFHTHLIYKSLKEWIHVQDWSQICTQTFAWTRELLPNRSKIMFLKMQKWRDSHNSRVKFLCDLQSSGLYTENKPVVSLTKGQKVGHLWHLGMVCISA